MAVNSVQWVILVSYCGKMSGSKAEVRISLGRKELLRFPKRGDSLLLLNPVKKLWLKKDVCATLDT